MQHIHGNTLSENVIMPFQNIIFLENQLDVLKQLWGGLKLDRKTKFIRKYGKIGQLMYVQVNSLVLRALIQH